VGVDDAADDLEGEPLGGRINREHLAAFHAVVILAEVDVLAGLQLAPMEEADGPGQQHDVAFLDRAIQKRLSRPRRFDHAAVVLQNRLEDPQPFTSRDDPLGDHATDDGAVHPRLQRCYRRDRAGVLVAARDVE
jgi:hypothetical protein